MFNFVMRIAAMLVLAATSAPASAQTNSISIGPDGVDRFLEALAAREDPAAAETLEEVEDNLPRFIFVPGVLGSRLTVPAHDGQPAIDLWGGETTLFDTPSLRITSDRIETGPLDDFGAIVTNVDVYGEALARLASKSINSDLLTIYSYDWRMDNVASAARLQEWLCLNQQKYAGHKVYFLTHSMGSLVVKYWYKNFRTMDCDNPAIAGDAGWIDVQEIIMLGAPLYGAPSAIEAFATGTDLTEGNIFGAAIRPWDRASAQLNEHGATFVSAYQLLPIYKESCFPQHDATQSPLFLRDAASMTSKIDDLFNAERWEELGWPVRLPDYVDRDEFYTSFLPKALEAAKAFQCELADYDLGAQVTTTYFYGVLPGLSTVNALEVRRSNGAVVVERDCKAAANECLDQGDGTVPAIIARNAYRASWQSARSTNYAHMDLLKSLEVDQYIATIISNSTTSTFARAASDPSKLDLFVDVATAAQVILPMYSTALVPDPSIVKINLATAAALDLDAAKISLFAQQAGDPASISQWTSMLELFPDHDEKMIFRNFTKAGIIAHSEGNFSGAIYSWDEAIKASAGLDSGSVKQDLGEIYVLRGDSWAEMGLPEAAVNDYEAAITFGNDAGKAGIEMLQHTPSNLLLTPGT